MGNEPLQNDHVRDHNRFLVYQNLKRYPYQKLSRAELSQMTNLSVPTVSTILHEFGRLRLTEGVGQDSTRGGRPAQLCRFNPDAYSILSVDLSQPYYQAARVDLLGRPRQHFFGPEHPLGDDHELFAWLGQLNAELSQHHRVAQLAVAVPGVVEATTGHIHLAPALGWHDYPLAAQLEKQLGCGVTLENDVNALAIAELYSGDGNEHSNVVYLSITSGIGLCLVINGQVYRGSTSAAGEVGYSTLGHIGGPKVPAALGHPGPLETHLLGLSQTFCTDQGLELGSAAARDAFEHFCNDLTVILQNALCLLNPERLVISWPSDTGGLLCRHLETHLNLPVPVQVVPASLSADGALVGVAKLALDVLEGRLCSTQRDVEPDSQLAER